MNKWKYFDITHRYHTYLNAMLPEKIDRLIQLLNLDPHSKVLDIACGNGELLLRLSEAYQVSGTGIDLSPYFIAKAQSQFLARTPEADLNFIELDGADFKPKKLRSFHLVSCLGASWIFGGHEGTLDALIELVEPGGLVIVGQPFWLQRPTVDYLEAAEIARNEVGSHFENVKAGEERGLNLIHTFVSTLDGWDMYEGLKWFAVEEYARIHPDDPDLPEILEKMSVEKEIYLKWGRDTMGWAIYIFRRALKTVG